MDQLLRDFLQETGEHIDAAGAQLAHLERDPSDVAMIGAVFRLLHGIKGTCGFLGLARLGRIAHAAETLLERLRDGAPLTPAGMSLVLSAMERIRFLLAETGRCGIEPEGSDDDLIAALSDGVPPRVTPSAPIPDAQDRPSNIDLAATATLTSVVRILIATRDQLVAIAQHSGSDALTTSASRLSDIVADLELSVAPARPLEDFFARLPRLTRDLGQDLGKEIALSVEGADIDLECRLVDALRDPLIQLIRNCADHGIEPAAERIASSKPARGLIRVAVSQGDGQIVIAVSDDGRGLDLPCIGAAALRRGLVTNAGLDAMHVEDIARLIFVPGLSTAPAVTAMSGRGVGLDIVRAAVEAMGGTVTVATVRNAGTRFTMRIPSKTAVAPDPVPAASVVAPTPEPDIDEPQEAQRFLTFRAGSPGIKALPLDIVHRIESVRPADIERSAGRLVVQRDDGLLALLPLIEGSPLRDPEQPVLIVGIAGHTFGLLVDEIVDILDVAPDASFADAIPNVLDVAADDGEVASFADVTHVPYDAMLVGRAVHPLAMMP